MLLLLLFLDGTNGSREEKKVPMLFDRLKEKMEDLDDGKFVKRSDARRRKKRPQFVLKKRERKKSALPCCVI